MACWSIHIPESVKRRDILEDDLNKSWRSFENSSDFW
jgi:hypothetical protein